jgi:hypothetical protein
VVIGSQKLPPGMHVIFLPYADDIRHPKFDPTPVGITRMPSSSSLILSCAINHFVPGIADAPEIAKAKDVIRSLQAKFDSTTFESPGMYPSLRGIVVDLTVVFIASHECIK